MCIVAAYIAILLLHLTYFAFGLIGISPGIGDPPSDPLLKAIIIGSLVSPIIFIILRWTKRIFRKGDSAVTNTYILVCVVWLISYSNFVYPIFPRALDVFFIIVNSISLLLYLPILLIANYVFF